MNIPEEVVKTLLAKRQIIVQGKIEAEIQERVCSLIVYLNALDDTPITIFIDSCGGLMRCGMYLFDAVSTSKAPVIGISTGVTASAAFSLLLACHKRLAHPHARLMFHAPEVKLRIDKDIKEELEGLKKIYEEQLKVLSKRSGQPIHKLREWARKEKYFDADEAKRVGYVDDLVMPTSPVSI